LDLSGWEDVFGFSPADADVGQQDNAMEVLYGIGTDFSFPKENGSLPTAATIVVLELWLKRVKISAY